MRRQRHWLDFEARTTITMKFEVEHKYRVADLSALEKQLASLDAQILAEVEQIDLYYAHPSRDFAATDEALRLRRAGYQNFITYKGPKIDSTTKTRREIELRLPPGDDVEAELAELLEALSFQPVAEVRKRRRPVEIAWQGHQVKAALDEVVGLGTFIELELVVAESQVDEAKECLSSIAKVLELEPIERRSYLELLLAK